MTCTCWADRLSIGGYDRGCPEHDPATQTPEGGSAPSSATEVPSARPPACCPGRRATARLVRAWWAERVAWRWSA